MYGWLTLDERGNPFMKFPEWDFKTSPVLTPQARAARVDRAKRAVQAAFPAEADARIRIASSVAIAAALRHVTDEQVDYAIHMGIAFHRLFGPNVQAQQRAIDALVDAEFGAIPDGADPAIKAMVERFKEVGLLLPQVSRGLIVNAFCTELRIALVHQASSNELMPLREAMGRANSQWRATGESHGVWQVVGMALTSSKLAELPQTERCVMQLLTQQRTDVLAELWKCYDSAIEDIGGALGDCALRQGLHTAVTEPQWSASQIASDAFSQARAWDRQESQILLRTSMAAIAAGVELGERTESSRAALRRAYEINIERQMQQMQALIQHARPSTTPPSPTPLQPRPDRETLQSWSVQQVSRWIEGPVTGPRRAGTLDRRRVAERSRVATPAIDRTPPALRQQALEEQDVDRIASQAYSATAEYFLGDINDLVSLGQQLRATQKRLDTCVALLDPLNKLMQAPDTFDEPHTLQLLSDAEQSITLLREDIKTVQATRAMQERFQARLLDALARETLSPGRRQGGVIGIPLTAEDWRWVSQRFHGRWLSSVTSLTIQGTPTPLGVDETLALYVTGSSLSHYAFDVSVHLWRRWPEKTSLPSLQSDPFPAMNADDWYDTHITCCVLHVPCAQ